MAIEGQFESAGLQIGKSIRAAPVGVVEPNRQTGWRETRVTRGRCEEKDLLAGGKDALAENAGKQFREPGSAREYVIAGADFLAAGGLDCGFDFLRRRRYRLDSIFQAITYCKIGHGCHGAARHQSSTVRLVYAVCARNREDALGKAP